MEKEKKGFTLIELLATIVILGIVALITIYVSVNILGDTEKTIDNTTKNLIFNSAKNYGLEFSQDPEFKKEVLNDGTISYCVKVGTLIEKGYYSKKDTKISEQKDKIVYVTIPSTGITTYEIVEGSSVDLKCNYYKEGSNFKIDEYTNISYNDNDVATINYSLTKETDLKYKSIIKFSQTYDISSLLKDFPVYFTLVLDDSGSMRSGKKADAAKNAAIKLVENILNDEKTKNLNIQIALIQYNKSVTVRRNFAKEYLTDKDFMSSGGTTNTSGAIDKAISLLTKKEADSLKYVLLLYDGLPNVYSSYLYNGNMLTPLSGNMYFEKYYLNESNISNLDCSNCYYYVKASTDYLKNEVGATLITIGYSFSSSNNYKILSSNNELICSANENNLCYFDSTSDKIYNLFNNLSQNITEEIAKNMPSKVKFVIKPSDKLIFTKDGEKQTTIEYEVDLLGTSIFEITDEYEIEVDKNVFSDCDSENECVKEVPLFDEIEIIFLDKDGNLKGETLKPESNSIITLSKTIASKLN